MQHGEERVYLGLKLKKKSQSFMAKNHGNGQQILFNSVSDRNEKHVVGNLQKDITC